MASDNEKIPRILLVEDDPDQSQLIRETLAVHYGDGQGGQVVAVASGAECLAQDLDSFDVVLMDYNLPDTSGLTLLEQVLAKADLPVIFVTGENDSATAAEAIQRGAQDYVVKLGDYLFAIPVLVQKGLGQHRIRQENERLQQELQSMLSELRVKNIQLEESLAKVERMASTDPLTGLANRRHFSQLLDRSYEEARRYGFDLTCCMHDLDHYKQLNDTLGHQVGDSILVLAADVIRSSLRSSDVAARYGGDEFVILLPHTSMDRAMAVAERTRNELAVETKRRCPDLPHPVTFSIGIASLGNDRAGSADELVAFADRALYAAKDAGKDRIVIHNQMTRVPQPAA